MNRETRLGPGAEFDRIRRILERLGPAATGVGNDCAVLPPGKGELVVSTDLAVEGVHFRREWLTLEEIGWRSAAAALSDLAAAGSDAVGVLTSLGVPAEAPPQAAEDAMAGIGAAVVAAGGVVLGGDLSRAPVWTINVTVLGRAQHPVGRAGASAGDGIWVSGVLGGARAALTDWQAGREPSPGAREAFARPPARLAIGRALAEAGATAMLDLSDGLGGDAGHLAAASGVALRIQLERLPLHPAVPAAAGWTRTEPGTFAALGGDDYELLAAMPPAFTAREAERLTAGSDVALTRIGEIGPGVGAHFLLAGREVPLTGYDHFA